MHRTPALTAGAVLAVLGGCAHSSDVRPVGGFDGATMLYRDQPYATRHERQRLDVHVPRDLPYRPPLVVYVHGGGWMDGRKEDASLAIAPYLAAGWAVANVEYRTGREAPAPNAVEDVICAIRWMAVNAGRFGVSAAPIVLAGTSAGAHLVMLAAFADSASTMGASCPGPEPRIAGVIDWAGPTDVTDLLAGANWRGWAVGWIGAAPGAEARARAVSPIKHVRVGLPPVLMVHGDSDRTVPFVHSVRLRAALDSAGVPAELVVLRGADHGPFRPEESAVAWSAVLRFLGARSGQIQAPAAR